jgi:hypothetical protein
MSDQPVADPADRIAAAVGRLRAGKVAVHDVVEGSDVRYEVTRSRYTVGVHVDPARFLGLEFDLLGPDGSVRLHYFLDTGRRDISQLANAWYASATATDIILFLDALAEGRVLTRVDRRRAAIIIPTGVGSRIVKRGRIWTSTGRDSRDREAAIRAGFQPLSP